MAIQRKRLLIIAGIVGLLLMIPLVAMQFTSDVNWSGFDFTIMGTLLLSAGLLIELVARKVRNLDYKFGFIIAILILFFLVWAELAVGIFGTPFAGS